MTDLRNRALTCACEMYLSDGLDGFSLRKLARALGVTAPALYRHYPSKQAVLQAVVAEAFKVFGSYLYRGLEGRTPQERLRLTGLGYVSFALDHPRFYEVIHLSPDILGGELPTEVSTEACATRQFIVDRVRECMDTGVLRQDDPEVVATAIWSFSHGLVSLYRGGLIPVPQEEFPEFFRLTTGRLFTGIGGEKFVFTPTAELQRTSHQPVIAS